MIGTLMMLDTGRWGIASKDRERPYELTSGDVFAVQIDGAMRITRMEFVHGRGGGYVSVDDLPLYEGMRAAIGEDMTAGREPNADERSGMEWWNGLDETERKRRLVQLERAGRPVTASEAWAVEKAVRS